MLSHNKYNFSFLQSRDKHWSILNFLESSLSYILYTIWQAQNAAYECEKRSLERVWRILLYRCFFAARMMVDFFNFLSTFRLVILSLYFYLQNNKSKELSCMLSSTRRMENILSNRHKYNSMLHIKRAKQAVLRNIQK